MPIDDTNWLLDATLQGAVTIQVYRWVDEALEELPNVQCLAISHGEGADPGSASFRYNLAYSGGPSTFEEVLDSGTTGDLIVEPDDQILVKATSPTGYWEWVFHGFVLNYNLSLSPNQEDVQFEAQGRAWRLWDVPIDKAYYRQCNTPTSTTANVETELPVHFNFRGLPNRCPDDTEVEVEGYPDYTYPVFLDQAMVRDEDFRKYWTLSDAVKYLLYRYNDEEHVLNPPPDEIEQLALQGPPEDEIDPVPSLIPIIVPDYPADGKDLCSTIFDLIREYGFAMRFALSGGTATSRPDTSLEFFQYQTGDLKDLYLPQRGTTFSPWTCNLQSANVRRDLSPVANQWEVIGRLDRYEVSFVLAPGFPSTSSDGSPGNLKNYDRSSSTAETTTRDTYRTWVFNEAGDGYYANTSTTRVTTVTDLDPVLDPATETPYLTRRRRPLGDLLTLGPDNKPLKARLDISTDYAGTKPGLWDGTGTWQPVTTSTWRLLPDRIGIWISEDNPNKWHIGESGVSGHPYKAGVVRVVEAISGAESTIPKFHLRLTCVIEGDVRVRGVAERRDRSPITRAITRHIDAKDRFGRDQIAPKSHYNNTDDFVSKRDDEDNATAEAEARRASAELGVLQGTAVVPYFTTTYKVGDRIRSINGRNLGFRTDGQTDDTSETEADPATYPVVTGVNWTLVGQQTTVLQLSDAGTARFKYVRRMIRGGKDG